METLSLLRLTPLRLLGLLVVSAVGSFIAATLVLDQPSAYTSTSTAFVSSALPPGASAFDVGPFVSDFEAAIELPGVRTGVAERAGIPEGDLDLSTNRNGEGSSVNVTSSHHDADVAQQTAMDAASSALLFLAGQQSSESSELVTTRTAEVEAARAALTAFETENNFVDPAKEYEILQQQAIELRLQADDRSNDYTIAQRQALLEQVSSIRQSLPTLASQRDQITRLRDSLARTEQKLLEAENARTGVESALAGASSDSVIPATAEAQSKIPQVVQAVVATTIVVFGLGIAMFFLADTLLKRARRKNEPVETIETIETVKTIEPVETVKATKAPAVSTAKVTPANDEPTAPEKKRLEPTPAPAQPAASKREPVTSRSMDRKNPPSRSNRTKDGSTDTTPARRNEPTGSKGSGIRQPPAKAVVPSAGSTNTPRTNTSGSQKSDSSKTSSTGVPATVGASSNGSIENLPKKPSTGLDRNKTPRKITKRTKNEDGDSDES